MPPTWLSAINVQKEVFPAAVGANLIKTATFPIYICNNIAMPKVCGLLQAELPKVGLVEGCVYRKPWLSTRAAKVYGEILCNSFD